MTAVMTIVRVCAVLIVLAPLVAARFAFVRTTLLPIVTTSAHALGTSSGPARNPVQAVDRAMANDNRVAAGRIENDTLVVRLTIRPADWHILDDTAPAFRVLAFAEDGKPPSIPAPLIRMTVGTPTSIHVRNPLDDTLIVRATSSLSMRTSMFIT